MSEKEFLIQGSLSLQPIEELEHPLMLKDRWHGENDLGLRVNNHIGRKTIYFGNIKQPWFKYDVKRYILYCRTQGKAFSTLFNNAQNIGCFAKFLEEYSVYCFDDINDEILSAYENSLFRLAKSTKRHRLICLKCFFDIGSLNDWFNVSTYFFQGKSARVKPNHDEIKYIPEIVLKQLDEHLSELPEQTQRMVVLLRTLGLRACELFQIKFDCLRQRIDGNWEIHFINWKFEEREDILPVVSEIAALIKEQQAYVKKHLKVKKYKYLFYRHDGNDKPYPKVVILNDFNNSLNDLAIKKKICDKLGKVWHFTSHQFRRTVATKMTNEKVRQYIIQRYLRHDNPDMMQHYAYISPETLKKEIKEVHKKKIVDVTGAEVTINHPELDNDIGLQWLRSKMQPKALAMGFCARPQLLKPCPHANACMSCEHFRLDKTDLPALKQHLGRNQKLKQESEQKGYLRQLKGIEEDTAKLINLIDTLESKNA